MSLTMLDNKPLSHSSAAPVLPAATEDATLATASASSRESSPRKFLVGSDGIYALPRLLIYLAMAWIVFQVEGWLLVSVQSQVNALWWRMLVEASMMLAAVLPGFAM